ncbi:MAG: D-alanine--D-alanine ligase [Candidatus Eiseniibacteriota bacterium]
MKRRIAVLMGGESNERDVSRVTGTEVAKALAERGHEVSLLDTARGAVALGRGDRPAIGRTPPSESTSRALAATGPQGITTLAGSLSDVDCVFIALHGGWGEDGTVQALFELAGIAYTGSGVLGSALAMDKDRAKRVFRASGVPTADWLMLDVPRNEELPEAELAQVHPRLGHPVVVKPNAEGSTVGLSLVGEGDDLREAVRTAARYGPRVMVERFVPGRELTVGILGERALPVVEIIPEGGLYTYEAKYTKGRSRYEVPARLPEPLALEVRRCAELAFRVLGCEGFARVDFRLPPDGAFQVLEVNTIPGMTPLSLVPMAAKAAGLSFGDLVERIVELGIERGTRRDRGPVVVAP